MLCSYKDIDSLPEDSKTNNNPAYGFVDGKRSTEPRAVYEEPEDITLRPQT